MMLEEEESRGESCHQGGGGMRGMLTPEKGESRAEDDAGVKEEEDGGGLWR